MLLVWIFGRIVEGILTGIDGVPVPQHLRWKVRSDPRARGFVERTEILHSPGPPIPMLMAAAELVAVAAAAVPVGIAWPMVDVPISILKVE